jgi:hydrogenase large subunit
MFVTPGVVVDGKLVSNDLVDVNLGMRMLLGSSYYSGWEDREMFVDRDPLGNGVDRSHPWNTHIIPNPQKRDFDRNYSWVMSPRWYDGQDHLSLDTGGGALARLMTTALSGLVDTGWTRATGNSIIINLPKTALTPESTFEWYVPKWSNSIERYRARSYFQAYSAAVGMYFVEKALDEVRAGHTKVWEPFTVPDEAIGCGLMEGAPGALSHHMVIRGYKMANYIPCSAAAWNMGPRDVYGSRALT